MRPLSATSTVFRAVVKHVESRAAQAADLQRERLDREAPLRVEYWTETSPAGVEITSLGERTMASSSGLTAAHT